MSQSRDLQEEGFAVLLGERLDTFTVDGIAGEKSGVLSGEPTVGNVLTDDGIVSLRTGELTCAKDVWTPVVGQMVTVRGLNLRVDRVRDVDRHWTAVLIESHQ